MPIEFRCPRCQKLLRTPDDTAGKSAQCPQCGEVQKIPPKPSPAAASGPAVRPAPGSGPPPFVPQHDPFARDGARASQPAVNPYQAPQAKVTPPAGPLEVVPRSGPAWERRGPSLSSFWETWRETLFNAPRAFGEMRRAGGMAAPAGFVVAGALVAIIASLAQMLVFLLIGIMAPAQQAQEPFHALLGYVIISGCSLAIGPLLMLTLAFLHAAVYHALLSIVGGANHGFEATFRVVAYAQGASYVLYLIPCFGGPCAFVAMLVLAIIGLASAQETTAWQACAAVLPPAVICCGAQVGLIVLSGIGA